MKSHNALFPFRTGQKFVSLEGLRRAVSYLEHTARKFGYAGDEVLFGDEFMLSVVSEKLTDGSIVLNATVAIAPKANV